LNELAGGMNGSGVGLNLSVEGGTAVAAAERAAGRDGGDGGETVISLSSR